MELKKRASIVTVAGFLIISTIILRYVLLGSAGLGDILITGGFGAYFVYLGKKMRDKAKQESAGDSSA